MKAEYSRADETLDGLIQQDMGTIWDEVGGQDGMYESFPIVRIYRDGEFIRCYALDSYGGVAIIASNWDTRNFRIVTLGEDDGYHFLNSANVYEEYYGNKSGFVSLISEALSIFNNNVEGNE